MPSNKISWIVHVDSKNKAMCEIRYADQVIYLPLEDIKDFSTKLNEWIWAIYPEKE